MEQLLLSTVVAALISAIISGVFNVLWANKLRRNSDIQVFRYTKLYELSNEIYSIKAMNYDLSDMQNLANQSSERHGLVMNIYSRAAPLLRNGSHKNKADSLLNNTEELSNRLVNMLYEKKTIPSEETPLKDLLLKRQEFEKEAKEALCQAMGELLV